MNAEARPAFVTFVLVASALVAFAGNSVLCRLALGDESIDPWSFTAVRLGAGALALGILAGERPRPLEWLALIGAAGGVVYLVLPGVSAPDPVAAASQLDHR